MKTIEEILKVLKMEASQIKLESLYHCLEQVYEVLKEFDKFKGDCYHQIFYYTYIWKRRENQQFLSIKLNMDQYNLKKTKGNQRIYLVEIKRIHIYYIIIVKLEYAFFA